MSKIQEALDLVQEECCEIGQQVSKIRRFGDDFKRRGGQDPSCKELFHAEVYDHMVLLDYLEDLGYFSWEGYEAHKVGKIQRLKEWTTLYDTTD